MKTAKTFEVNDLVFLRAPEREDKFSAGWNEPYMRPYEGTIARVLNKRMYDGSLIYQICHLEDYERIQEEIEAEEHEPFDTWWWDPEYMDLVTQTEDVSDDEYENVLFEG